MVDEVTTNITPGNPMSPMGTNYDKTNGYRCQSRGENRTHVQSIFHGSDLVSGDLVSRENT